jgi:hypothetical protein
MKKNINELVTSEILNSEMSGKGIIRKSVLAKKALEGDSASEEQLLLILDNKELCIYFFLKTLNQLSSCEHIFFGEVDGIQIIVDTKNDGLYRDGLRRCKLVEQDGELYGYTNEGKLVKVCNKAGELNFSKIQFTTGNTTAGTGYKAIKLSTKQYGNEKTRSHYFSAATKWGVLVLDCMGDDRILEVNHIDCNKKNNSVNNLEIISHKENMQHNARVKYEIMAENFKKWFGVILPKYRPQGA